VVRDSTKGLIRFDRGRRVGGVRRPSAWKEENMNMTLVLAVSAALLNPAPAEVASSAPYAYCNCEHLGSPFDDICEAGPQGEDYTYSWYGYNGAILEWSPEDSPFKQYRCPVGEPGCHIKVSVHIPGVGSTRLSTCYGN
jgi:hypothetical protein